jgi:hypothetical protein
MHDGVRTVVAEDGSEEIVIGDVPDVELNVFAAALAPGAEPLGHGLDGG